MSFLLLASMKFSKYTYIKEVNDEIVALYHSLLVRTVFVTKTEFRQIEGFFNGKPILDNSLMESIKYLFKYYFIINEENEDKQLFERCLDNISSPSISNAYIVVTENCNFNCKYCFISQAVQEGKTMKVMSEDVARNAARLLQHTYEKKQTPYDKTITFYGGEPLMNFKAIQYFFDEIHRIIEDNKYWPSDVKYALITNGSLIDEEKLAFLKNERVALSISYDVNLTSSQRIAKNGQDSNQIVYEKIKMCQHFGYPFSLSVTISEEMLKYQKLIIRELIALKPATIAFNMLIPSKQLQLEDEYYENATTFMIESFKTLREEGIFEDRMMRKVHAFEENKMFLYDCCASGGNQYVIEPNGRIGICHGYLNNLKFFSDNVVNPNFDFTQNKDFLYWKKRSPIYMEQCQDCKCIGICGGGCPYAADYMYGSIYSLDTRFCIHAKKVLDWMILDLYSHTFGAYAKA